MSKCIAIQLCKVGQSAGQEESPVSYYRLLVDYTPGQWAELPSRASDLLKAVDQETAAQDARLHLFWPYDADQQALVVVEGTTGAPNAVNAIAGAAGGALRRVEAFNVEIPPRELTSTETTGLIAEAAFRGELLRCRGCGRGSPPHLDDCPFKRIEEPAALVVESTVSA
jgi:hypothetical protein